MARLAGAHEFTLELPHGYDTEIGKRGSTLSCGEATSALDDESERIVQENMRAMARGRTVLIIAHRLAAVREADRIITVEQGRVTEDGAHEELLARGGGVMRGFGECRSFDHRKIGYLASALEIVT
ncbi:hypothetical protein [Roseomonas sp. GC11]|uniref:hypothetical protein n=1 Tax=Roseomonas sp. GC11 TaxID=2950546 RepID=UPI00272E26E5|nr:hypothetical protein [Roseomonas sp. GC11]